MYIVEWNDHEGNRHEKAFDNQEDARREAAYLETIYDHVAVIAEVDV